MKTIQLTQGQFAIVDDADFAEISKYKWQAKKYRKTYYAARSIRQANGKQKTVNMHRIILNCPDGYEVDHIDGNGLNNQRSNIRIVTTRQNHQNLHRTSTSKYPGVCWDKDNKLWQASIRVGEKIKKLGRHRSEHEAYLAYLNELRNLGETPLSEVV